MKALIENVKVLLAVGLFTTLSVGCSDLGQVTSLEGRSLETGEPCTIGEPDEGDDQSGDDEVTIFVEWGCNGGDGGDYTPPPGDDDGGNDDGGDDDGGDDDGGNDDGGDDGDEELCDDNGCCISKDEVQDQTYGVPSRGHRSN